MAATVGLPFARWLAVSAGAVVALVPTMGPFVALLAIFGVRHTLRRSDGVWWLAALAMGLPWLASGNAMAGLLTSVQVLAAWLLFRAAEEARRAVGDGRLLRDAGLGLLLGLVGVTLAGIARIEALDVGALYRFSQVIAWREHPTLFGHAVLTVSALVAISASSSRRSLAALAIGAVGVLVTGALEAVVAWLLVAAVVTLAQRRLGVRLAHLGLVITVAIVIAGAGSLLGLGQTGFLVDLERDPTAPNLLQGSELAAGDWWHALDVAHEPGSARLDGAELVTFALTKTGEQAWARLQQRARLDPGLTTVSVYLRPEPDTRPGIDLWGRLGSGANAQEFNVYATVRGGDTWRANARGPVELVDARLVPIDGARSDEGWLRAAITVRHEGASQDWYVGVTPDRSAGAGGRTTFAGLQMERGGTVGSYVPAPAERALDLRTARLPVWGDAVDAIRAAPWHGWGPQGLPAALSVLRPDEISQRALPAHAHNAFLDAWLERGPLGMVGLLLLVAALASRAVRRRDLPALAVVAAVVLMNLLDTSLLYGGVLYPLAVLLGWRAGAVAAPARDANLRSQTAARLGLVLGDLAAVWTAVGVSALLGSVLDGRAGFKASWAVDAGTLAYLLLLWPLLMLREGLYPGYGTSPANELRKSVQAAATAGAIVVLVSQLFPDVLGLPLGNALALALAGTVLAPLARGASKRVLLALGGWGTPVLVIGNGRAATRVTTALQRRQLDGLRPVAVFSDDPHLGEQRLPVGDQRGLAGVPIVGAIDDALAYGRRSGVDHAIVALPGADPDALQALVERLSRTFRRVQFIPNLATLPSHGVYATDLDHMLALELRLGLLNPGNRAVKRLLDLTGVLLGAIVAAPAVLLIALAIRLDTPGPVFYTHERIGRGGRRFRMWKFRTMVRDADAVLSDLLARDPAAREEWAQSQKLEHDPRVTRVGGWLRRLSLDELPQLWNVLRGEMSVIGPRPIVDAEVHHYGADLALFSAVPPGISGYWQVSGRSRIPYPERVEYDTYYVRNWSIWLDAVILARTVGVVLRREGAY